MLFNSFEFFVFFVCVYGLYLIFDHRRQNWLLLVASYIFYGAWDWRFLFLIFLSTLIDYFCGLKIHTAHQETIRRRFLFLSVISNIGILGFFKYFNFFVDNFAALIESFGVQANIPTLNIILPVGISFYTFQTMSYTIDIYKKELSPTHRFDDFALFVAFFPQLVAGPIERAKHLLPQMMTPRTLRRDWFWEGLFLIFWGLYQKIFIADNLARFVDPVFQEPSIYFAPHIWLALYAFAFQIYCDFAGYSNMARGLGRVMGFDIMVNFRTPYFATNPREFWQRWHISLSTWLRDYLYIPLGGNRKGRKRTFINLLVVMTLGGLWHGANWTFIVWGLFHAALLIVFRYRPSLNLPQNVWMKSAQVFLFFHLICISWLLFRAESISQAMFMFQSLWTPLQLPGLELLLNIVPYLLILLVIDSLQFQHDNIFVFLKANPLLQSFVYLIVAISLLSAGVTIHDQVQKGIMEGPRQFIYFQF